MTWALQDAKNRFSEVVDLAESKGPQVVTRRGQSVAVIISYADYQSSDADKGSFVDALLSCPRLDEEGLDCTRDEHDYGREVML